VYKKIVLGVDGSENGARAMAAAFAIAKAAKTLRVTLVHGAVRVEEGKQILADAEQSAKDAGVRTESVLREGQHPGDALVDVADEKDANLVVVGSRGLTRAKRLIMGGVSNRVAHQAPCDVLIVRTGPASEDGYTRLLVATDGSTTADRCARKGYNLAKVLGTNLTSVFVGHPKTGEIVLRDTHDSMEEPPETTFRICQGDPADKIIDTADEEKVDLIVVGNKGMTGARRFLLGSVPQKVMQFANCDVLITRTTTQPLAEIGVGQAGLVSVDGKKIAVYRDEQGTTHAVVAKCTHLGCTVGWNAAEKTWDCPCHGSRYAIDGTVINGPAQKPLPKTFV
jgi:nucleotide-binding universal stress UspA family protein